MFQLQILFFEKDQVNGIVQASVIPFNYTVKFSNGIYCWKDWKFPMLHIRTPHDTSHLANYWREKKRKKKIAVQPIKDTIMV